MSLQPDVVLAACPVCGDPTVKLDHVRKCVDKLKLERRGFRLMVKKLLYHKYEHQTAALREGRYERCGGDAECPICRLPLFEHPEIPALPTFHLLCDHRIVKL